MPIAHYTHIYTHAYALVYTHAYVHAYTQICRSHAHDVLRPAKAALDMGVRQTRGIRPSIRPSVRAGAWECGRLRGHAEQHSTSGSSA